MPEFIVREVTDNDLEGFRSVRSRVYRGGAPVFPDERVLRSDSIGFVVLADGAVVGAATALSMTCSHDGEHVPCAGVASVGVLPEWRGSGAGSALMHGLRPLLLDRGFVVASLHPFRDPWYRRFGYASVGVAFQIECPADRVPKGSSDLGIHELEAKRWPELVPICEAVSRRYNGFNLRTTDQWWRTLGGDTPMTIYVAGDPIEAFCILRLQSDFWVSQPIKECLWITDRGHDALLGHFRMLGFNKTSLTWIEPADSPTLRRHFDRGSMKASLVPPAMYRLLAVESDSDAHDATANWLGAPERVYNLDAF